MNRGGSRISVWGGRSSAEGARIEGVPLPIGGGGSASSPENFLILGSQNAYFGAVCGPPESDSVVPAMWMVMIITTEFTTLQSS